MLRLPSFEVIAPETLEEAVAALARPGARVIAGGTDLLPNVKHRLDAPPRLVSVQRIADLRGIVRGPDAVVIGAAVTLAELSADPDIAALFPSLAQAAGAVASPPIRNMATIGGNVHLDTRCRYVNQSAFWRSAIHGCLKADGEVCHVVPGGQRCVAAMSADCVPALITLDAEIALVGARGRRTVRLADYYRNDGTAHIKKGADEIMSEVRLPIPTGPTRATYVKWTVRQSIDFPLLSVALRFDLASSSGDSVGELGDARRAKIAAAKVCVGVLNARPRVLPTDRLIGRELGDDAVIDELCASIYQRCRPLENVPYEAPYRRKMLPVYTRRAMMQLVSAGIG